MSASRAESEPINSRITLITSWSTFGRGDRRPREAAAPSGEGRLSDRCAMMARAVGCSNTSVGDTSIPKRERKREDNSVVPCESIPVSISDMSASRAESEPTNSRITLITSWSTFGRGALKPREAAEMVPTLLAVVEGDASKYRGYSSSKIAIVIIRFHPSIPPTAMAVKSSGSGK